MRLDNAIDNLARKFISGNSIITGRTSILLEEWEGIADGVLAIRTIITDLKTKSSGSMQDYMDAIKKIEEIVK